MEDRRALRSTLLVGLPGIAAVLLLYTVVYPTVTGGEMWLAPDIPMATVPGLALLHGHLGAVYANRYFYDLPLSLPVTGFIQQVLLWLHIRWWRDQFVVTEIVYMLIGLVPVYLARRLAWALGLRRRLTALQAATFAVVALPTAEWGHLEDVIALIFVMLALRSLMGERPVAAAVYLSLAVSSKQWAVMLIPVVVLSAPVGRRVRTLAAAVALPAALAGAFLIVDLHEALRAFTSPVTQVKGFPGHPWIAGAWLGPHSSAANRAGAVLIATGFAWMQRRRLHESEALVTIGALTLLIRPLTETINYAYYWIPGLTLLLVATCTAHPGRRWQPWLWAVAALVWTLPRSNDAPAMALGWWAGELLLLVMAARQLPPLRAAGQDLAVADPVGRRPLATAGR